MNRERKKRKVIGLIESVKIIGERGAREVFAKIDTGASRTSVDNAFQEELGLGPSLDTIKVRSASSNHPRKRQLVRIRIKIKGELFLVDATLEDRSMMKYPVLIGMDVLGKGRFLIDPKSADVREDHTSTT